MPQFDEQTASKMKVQVSHFDEQTVREEVQMPHFDEQLSSKKEAQMPHSDEQLVIYARAGDMTALEALLSRFKPMVKAKAAMYFLSGGDRDDLIQEGMIGLYKAVLDYAPEKNPVFGAFASLCVNRQIQTAIKTAARQKHTPLNASLTLTAADETQGTAAASADDNPETLFISRESSKDIAAFILRNLSVLEHNVLMLQLEGLNHAQIAQTLGKPLKSVDNTLQRVRRKLKALKT